MNNNSRLFLPTIADLVDALSIDQIKEIKFEKNKHSFALQMEKICHDIDLIIKDKKQIKLSSKLIRIIIVIAQMNLFIWHTKDQMRDKPDQYDKLLKLAHQLNGIRNRMKNMLLEEVGDKNLSLKRTNVETDDLKGWDISIK